MDGEETNEIVQNDNPEPVTDNPESVTDNPESVMHSRIVALEEKIKEMIGHMNARLGTKIGG